MAVYRFRTEPMAHQRAALRKIIATKGRTMLLMDPGTGKTKVALDYAAMLTLRHGSLTVLVSAPLSALDTWIDQANQHLPLEVLDDLEVLVLDDGSILDKAQQMAAWGRPRRRGLRMVVVNHDAYGSRRKVPGLKTVTLADRMVQATHDLMPGLVVLDEIHRFKSHTTNRSRAMRRALRGSGRVLGLTGTVAPRNVLDVWGQWRLVNPDRFPDRYGDFEERYAVRGGWMGKEIIGWQRLDELRALVAADAHVVRKADALDLPPVTEVEVPVRLSARERRAYLQMYDEAVADLPGGRLSATPAAIVKILRLRQLTGGYVGNVDDDGSTVETRLGLSKVRVCADKVAELVSAGEKVVVFAHFRPDLEAITAALHKIRPKVGWIAKVDGSTPSQQRVGLRKGFQSWDGPAVLVAQMRTMSLAVNELVVANHAIFFSLSERRDDFDQAKDRLNRLGQTRPVTFHHLVVPGTIDTALLKAHQHKLDLEHAVTDTRRDLGGLA